MGDYYGMDGDDLDGDDLDGDVMGFDVVGARGRARRAGRGGARMARIPQRPGWRNQLAPGVIQPDEGLVPLPLSSTSATSTFTAAVTSLTFQGQLQKPFRGERVLVSVSRTGTTATPARFLGQFFVGTDLQQADIQAWDMELIGNPNSFGTRLTMKSAEPGVLIRVLGTLSSALAGTDTVAVTVLLLGRIVH
jgi:hypothetical protein